MPDQVPEGQLNTQWGNRGYVFVGTAKKVVGKTVKKPVRKIVRRARVVKKYLIKFLNLKDVYFLWNSSAFTSLSLQTLKSNADILKANPNVKVLLIGSASPEGAVAYNQKLSERRVNAVKNYLVVNEKIAANRLDTQVKGALPVKDKNEWPFARKVEFSVMD